MIVPYISGHRTIDPVEEDRTHAHSGNDDVFPVGWIFCRVWIKHQVQGDECHYDTTIVDNVCVIKAYVAPCASYLRVADITVFRGSIFGMRIGYPVSIIMDITTCIGLKPGIVFTASYQFIVPIVYIRYILIDLHQSGGTPKCSIMQKITYFKTIKAVYLYRWFIGSGRLVSDN